jgi:tRNA dimethylallyltransferase
MRALHALFPSSRGAAARASSAATRLHARMAAGSAGGAGAPPPPPPPRPKILVITGPTAVGKTAASLALAERLGAEVISADSVQVYRGLDVGSDKLPPAARRGVPHHLLDALDPADDFSAGDFYDRARAQVDEVLARGRTPLVVGGTGFYLRWLMRGKPATPPATAASEAAAAARLAAAWAAAEAAAGAPLGAAARWEAGCALVEALGDPAAAADLRGGASANNMYRLGRVVDILLQARAPLATLAAPASAAGAPYDFRAFFLPRPREELYRRIDARVEEMVAGGLVGEAARELAARGLGPDSCSAARAIGYRQALEFLARLRSADAAEAAEAASEAGVARLVREVQAASRGFCHRQLNWFRGDPDFRWVDAARPEEEIVAEVLAGWEAPAFEGGGGTAKLDAAAARAMRTYVPRVERFAPGTGAAAAVLAEARAALEQLPPPGEAAP